MNSQRLPHLLAAALGGWLFSHAATAADQPPTPGQAIYATPYFFTTLAGGAGDGHSVIDGTGSEAGFAQPNKLAVDSSGNIFVAEQLGHTIRKVTPAGVATVFAGQPRRPGADNGPALTAKFHTPIGLAFDSIGNLFVTDWGSHTIRKITPAGVVSNFAGQAGVRGTAGGLGTEARFDGPSALAIDRFGNLHVVDSEGRRIRRITPGGFVMTFVGHVDAEGTADGNAATARFRRLGALAFDANGNLYAADMEAHTIRRITPTGEVTTYAGEPDARGSIDAIGSAARFDLPHGLAVDHAGNLFVCDFYNRTVRKVAPNRAVTTVAGLAKVTGDVEGLGSAARFHHVGDVAVDASGNLFVSDYGYNKIRRSVFPPAFQSQPTGLTVNAGATAVLAANVASDYPLTFQWRKNGVPVAGATDRILTLANAQTSDAGVYTLVATNIAGSVASAEAQLVVNLPAPVITNQPVNQAVDNGTFVQFSVGATPTGAAYQWRRNGVALAGATEAILTIAAATAADAGSYSVSVTNASGSVTSASATLTVRPAPVSPTPPVIGAHPQGRTVAVGEAFSLVITATGTAPITFQWFRNGAVIAGATRGQFSVTRVQPSDAGAYHVVVSNSAGTATSNTATITVNEPVQRPAIAAQPRAQTATAGAGAQFSVSANGTGPLSFQWRKDGVAIPGATGATLALASVQARDAGSYSVTVTNSAGSVTSTAAALTVTPSSRLSNLSIRTSMAQDQIVIVGLAVAGGARDVLVRAVGPALAQFGLSGAMADPRLELFRGQTLVLGNDNWAPELAPTFASVGAFALPLGSRDSAIRQDLDGAVSLQARGSGSGVVLLEAYDVGENSTARLVNVSARNRVGTGDDIMIAGFNLTGTGNKRLLVRAVGPGLAAFGVTGALADPKLELFAGSNKIAENDNWSADVAPEFTAVGAFALPLGSRDAALVVTLPPGTYTAQARGGDGTAGEALVEIYELP